LSGRIDNLNINAEPVEMSYAKENLPKTDVDVEYKVQTCTVGGDDEYGGDETEGVLTPACTDIRPSLKFDVYYPTNHPYNTCKLPALIMFHGGSYAECSDKRNAGVVALCKEFAYRGFVVFSVEYRRGVLTDNRTVTDILSGKTINYTTAQQMLAIYRACQDGRGAIRSIVKYEKNGWGTGHIWRIDIDKIFVGGISAGSVVAMHSVYYQNQSQWNAVFQGNIVGSLGDMDDIDNDYYYAGSETPFPDYDDDTDYGTILGVIDCWGALFVPATVAYNNDPFSFFVANDGMPPLIGFHGKADETFDYNRQAVYFSRPGTTYPLYEETNCLYGTYNFIDNSKPDAILLRTQSIYEMFRAQMPEIFSEFYKDCHMAHGLDDDCGDCPSDPANLSLNKQCNFCIYDSDFGTGAINSEETLAYIAGRGATFFQTILSGSSALLLPTVSKFVECENQRVTCTGTVTTGCNNDPCND